MKIDDSRWPLVEFLYPEDGDLIAIDDMYAQMEALLRRALGTCRLAFLHDIRLVSIAASTPVKRRRIADHVTRLKPLLREVMACEATVADSLWTRAAVKAVHLLSPLPWPAKVMSRTDDARAWLVTTLDAQRLRANGA